jgi:predicted house-cleaning noncanonical NTP pyrophosphatase (MazG superfamily)
MAKQYHKLIRDKIPEIIERTGKTCKTEILSDDNYLALLDEKLGEELAEYQESKSLEELADLLEVMETVVVARGYSWEQLLRVKAEKKAARGGFEDKLLLLEVSE